MSKPVWILLPHLADWRWMQQRQTTPWYPTARLIRQTAPGDWAGLVKQAANELGAFNETRLSRLAVMRLAGSSAHALAAG